MPQLRDAFLDQLVRRRKRCIFAQSQVYVPRGTTGRGQFDDALRIRIELRAGRRTSWRDGAGFDLADMAPHGLDIELQTSRDFTLLDALTPPFLDGLEKCHGNHPYSSSRRAKSAAWGA